MECPPRSEAFGARQHRGRAGAVRGARLASLATAALLTVPGRTAAVPAQAREQQPALVVITPRGLAPSELRVAPGVPIVWLNRTSRSAIAISFDRAFPSSLESCAVRRAFHAVPGHGPFTMLLPPGSVASLCAPHALDRYGYTVHGEVALAGAVEVVEGNDPEGTRSP